MVAAGRTVGEPAGGFVAWLTGSLGAVVAVGLTGFTEGPQAASARLANMIKVTKLRQKERRVFFITKNLPATFE